MTSVKSCKPSCATFKSQRVFFWIKHTKKKNRAFSCRNTPENGAPFALCWQNHLQQASSTKSNLGGRTKYFLPLLPYVSNSRLRNPELFSCHSLRNTFLQFLDDLKLYLKRKNGPLSLSSCSRQFVRTCTPKRDQVAIVN